LIFFFISAVMPTTSEISQIDCEQNSLLAPSISPTVSEESKMPSYHPPNFSGFWIFAKLASSLTHKLGRETPKSKFSLDRQTFSVLFHIYFGENLCLFGNSLAKSRHFCDFLWRRLHVVGICVLSEWKSKRVKSFSTVV